MRSVVASFLLLVLVPLAAHAGVHDAPVIGGRDAPAGKWPDVAAVNWSGEATCTGTLIAPTIVLTAGHCNDATLDSVLIGTSSLARPQDGEAIKVIDQIEYEDSQRTEDVTVLVLEHAATNTPRRIASGWARVDIRNGAHVTIVGFGAVDRGGPILYDSTQDEQYVDELQEAMTTVTDADCTLNASNGCNARAMPAGELGAGGMGIDTCPGDSGGPLYLTTDYGTFLAGVTSRSYDDAIYWCSEGGIYARPDKVVDWIEEVAGVPIARGPEPTYDPMVAVRGHAVESLIVANDPKSDAHTYEITTPPAHGKARVRDDGLVRVCTQDNVALQDSLVVTITDTNDTSRKLAITMPLTITDGDAFTECSVDDYGTEGSDGDAGCCNSGHGVGGALPLAVGVLALLHRRRRRWRTEARPAARGRSPRVAACVRPDGAPRGQCPAVGYPR